MRYYAQQLPQMPLALNPVDVWKLFKDGKKQNRERIAEWLDDVADEADALSQAWTAVCTELSRSQFQLDQEQATALWRSYFPFGPNERPYQRLYEFYQRATEVLGGKTEEAQTVHEAFTHTLSSLLFFRADAIKTYEQIFNGIKSLTFLDTTNSIGDLRDLYHSVTLLNREAAALHVLAKTFRALP